MQFSSHQSVYQCLRASVGSTVSSIVESDEEQEANGTPGYGTFRSEQNSTDINTTNTVSVDRTKNVHFGHTVQIPQGVANVTVNNYDSKPSANNLLPNISEENSSSSKRKISFVVMGVLIIICSVIALSVYLLIRPEDNTVHYVRRKDWMHDGNHTFKYHVKRNKMPFYKIHLNWTCGSYTFCSTREKCIKAANRLVNQDDGLHSHPIFFNFLIGDDNNVYELLGFNLTYSLSKSTVFLSIAFMGNNMQRVPSQNQLNTYEKFHREAVAAGNIRKPIKWCIYEKPDCFHARNSTFTKCPSVT